MSTARMRWKLPADPWRPNLPYVEGFRAKIKAHRPPPPFGGSDYDVPDRSGVIPGDWMLKATHSAHVLKYPPIETPDLPNPKQADLTITKPIATGDTRGAQVVQCTVTPHSSGESSGSEQPFVAVAKIYDALYYSFEHDQHGPHDAVYDADEDYSREAAAYEQLEAERPAGDLVPRYFGSWTFTLPLQQADEVVERPVRLVLIEYLDGLPMSQLIPFTYSEAVRLEIVARILDGIVKMKRIGIHQSDETPSNVILVPSPEAKGESDDLPRVVLIDYDFADIDDRSLRKYPSERAPLPKNPMVSTWEDIFEAFKEWIPEKEDDDHGLWRQWLRSRFGRRDVLKQYADVQENSDSTENNSNVLATQDTRTVPLHPKSKDGKSGTL